MASIHQTEVQPFTVTVIHCWSAPRSRSTALLYSFEARNANDDDDCANNEDGDTIALDEPLYRRWLKEKTHGSGGSSANYGISRPYAESFLKGVPPPPSDDDAENVIDAWRWEREKQCLNERIYHSVKTLLDRHMRRHSNQDSSNIDFVDAVRNGQQQGGIIFLKQMAKFSHLFDFESNWETDHICSDDDGNSHPNEAKYWKDQFLQLLSENKHVDIQLKHRHVLLIRDPISVHASWMGKSGQVHGNNPHPDEVGIVQLLVSI